MAKPPNYSQICNIFIHLKTKIMTVLSLFTCEFRNFTFHAANSCCWRPAVCLRPCAVRPG